MMTASKTIDGQPTILIVEDDEDDRWLRDVVADILESSGYQDATANNGKQANDYLATACDPPAAILMDLVMPILKGEFLLGLKGTLKGIAYKADMTFKAVVKIVNGTLNRAE